MGTKILLTPAELQAQAVEMRTLAEDYEALFGNVGSTLNKVNGNWSANLANNFTGKITTAQRSFQLVTQELMNGAQIADTSAKTFESVDSQLAKLYCTGVDETSRGGMQSYIDGLVEEAQTAGDALGWIEEQFEKLPHWITSGVDELWDLFVPEKFQDLKDAYEITSKILQGEFDLKEAWDVFTDITKKNTKLAIFCETINYTFETGMARDAEMQAEIEAQLREGDVLGAVFDGAEGFVDTIIGGTVEVLGDVGGGLVDGAIDNIPVVKGINKLVEYGTGLWGWNDGNGYSVGGLIGEAAEKVSVGLDAATDFITDATNVVTDAVTDGVKSGINWVKSWFD